MRWLVFLLAFVAPWPAFAAAPMTDLPPFPRPLESYGDSGSVDVWSVVVTRAFAEPFNLVATIIFLLAIIHTFLAPKILGLSHRIQHDYEAKLREIHGPDLKEKIPRRHAPEHSGGGASISWAKSRRSSASGRSRSRC